MTAPGWYFKEAIEQHLERLGAQTWTYQEDPSLFRVGGQTGGGAVERAQPTHAVGRQRFGKLSLLDEQVVVAERLPFPQSHSQSRLPRDRR